MFEVSSPGLGRPLKKEKDYIRSVGKEIDIIGTHFIILLFFLSAYNVIRQKSKARRINAMSLFSQCGGTVERIRAHRDNECKERDFAENPRGGAQSAL